MRKPRATSVTFLSIGVLASAELLPMLGKSLWLDEGASLYSARLGWIGLWRQSTVVDRVFLFYYALLHLWVDLSDSIEWVRFLSVIAFGLTVIIIGHLGNRIGGFWSGVIASVLTALNPLMLNAALDSRPYALSALAATIAVYSLVRRSENGEDRWLWLFCLASLVTLLLHIFAILGPLAFLLILLLQRPMPFRRYWRRQVVVPLGLMVSLSVVYAALVLGQRGQVAWIRPMTVASLLIDAYGPAGGYPSINRSLYARAIIVLVVVAVLCIWRARRRGRRTFDCDARRYLFSALAWAALPTVALIAVSFVKPLYVDRYVTASAPGMALAIGLLLAPALKLNDAKRPIRERRIEGVASVLVAAGLIANSVAVASTAYENYAAATNYLRSEAGKISEIALPDHSVATIVEYYLHGSRQERTLWPEASGQLHLMTLDLREDEGAFESARRNVWVVEDGTLRLRGFLRDLTSHGYVVVSTRDFVDLRSLTVVHYKRSG